MCLLYPVLLIPPPFSSMTQGFSTTIELGVFSAVCLGLITNAWPPMLPADPGRIRAVVTPPAWKSKGVTSGSEPRRAPGRGRERRRAGRRTMERLYDASCVLIPSRERRKGRMGPLKVSDQVNGRKQESAGVHRSGSSWGSLTYCRQQPLRAPDSRRPPCASA